MIAQYSIGLETPLADAVLSLLTANDPNRANQSSVANRPVRRPLHRAIEKLRARGGVSSLTPEEREVYLAYRRQQQRELLAQKTPEERRALRAKWREVWRHRKKR